MQNITLTAPPENCKATAKVKWWDLSEAGKKIKRSDIRQPCNQMLRVNRAWQFARAGHDVQKSMQLMDIVTVEQRKLWLFS